MMMTTLLSPTKRMGSVVLKATLLRTATEGETTICLAKEWNGLNHKITLLVEGGRGLSGHFFWIWDSGMLPPNLGHIVGCLALSEFLFFAKNKTLQRSNHFFENTMITFFYFFIYWPKHLKTNNLEQKYGSSYLTFSFRTNFEPQELHQPEKKWKCMFSSCWFLKSDFTLVGFHFGQQQKFEKAKYPRISSSFGGNMPKAQI